MKVSTLKASILSFAFLFTNFVGFSQTIPNEQMMTSSNLKYGEIIKLIINEKDYFEDSLSIKLTSFSHKRSLTGGSTKATAYLNLSKNNVDEVLLLSVHGTDGKPNLEEYDSLSWEEYEFQLKSFKYDQYIEVVVTIRKKKI